MPQEYSQHQSPYGYKLLSFKITSHRHDVPIDITNNISMFEIYEGLESPYLTGSFIMLDDLRFFDGVDVNGTEKCEIILDNPTVESAPVTLNFVISHLKGTQKVQDQKEMLDFAIIEDSGFNNEIIRLSRSYQGTHSQIISKILLDGLGLEMDFPEIESVQPSIKVCLPYMTPLQACNWILRGMTTSSGLPFFLFKTIKTKNIQLKSLEEMILLKPWNKTPYVFSLANANAQGNAQQNIDSVSLFNVESFGSKTETGIIHKMLDGDIGSSNTVTDMGSGQSEKFQYNVNSVFDELKDLGIIPKGEQPIFHTAVEFKDLNIANHNNLNIHRLVMNGTYRDHNNIYEGYDKATFKLDAVRRGVSNYLQSATASLEVPGAPFLLDQSDRSVGTRINFVYIANKTEVTEHEDGETMADLVRSGNYMISNARHLFTPDKEHKTLLTGVKLGRRTTG
jgi:hypothetical protein